MTPIRPRDTSTSSCAGNRRGARGLDRRSPRTGVAAWLAFGLVLAPVPAVAQADVAHPIFVDDRGAVATGAASLLGAHDAVTTGLAAVIPARLGAEASAAGKVGGVTYRLARLSLVELPLSLLATVAVHEVFGHGARLREFDYPSVEYVIEAPYPYGGGSGATVYALPAGRVIPPTETAAIATAGIESDALTAHWLAQRWLGRGSLTLGEATRYLLAQLDALGYPLDASDSRMLFGDDDGHDVDRYIGEINAADAGRPGAEPLTARTVRRRTLLGLVNPNHAFALWAVFGAYLAQGRDRLAVPALRLGGDVRYLPLARYSLTPFGGEYRVDQMFVRQGRGLTITARLGDGKLPGRWGVGAMLSGVTLGSSVAFDAQVDLWRRAAFSLGGSALTPVDEGLAAGAIVTGRWLPKAGGVRIGPYALGLSGQLGYKSAGYVEGERLDRGAVWRVGLVFVEREAARP